MRQQPWPAETRQKVLRLYVSEGPAGAGRATGVPLPTIFRWARAAGLRSPDAVPPEPAVPAQPAPVPGWAGCTTDLAGLLGEAIDRAVRAFLAQLDRGQRVTARDLAELLRVAVPMARQLGYTDPGKLSPEEAQERLNRMVWDLNHQAPVSDIDKARERRKA
jgi:hypothetical protein